MYHNGSDSLINRNDTGDLYIQNYSDDGDIRFYSDNGSGGTAEYIRCDGGLGQVKLFSLWFRKFITTSAGIKVTGEVNVTSELEINGTDVIDSSRNLLNIGTITQTTNGEILDSSANLTNINNVYASGYRIGSTQIVDSSRNLTNINSVTVAGSILHQGDTDTSVQFTNNQIQLNTGGSLRFQANNSAATVLGIPLIVSAPNSAEMQFKQTTSSTTASKGSVQWFDSSGNSCGTINLKANML